MGGGGSLLARLAVLVLLVASVPTCDDPAPPTPIGGLILVIRTLPGTDKEMGEIDHIDIQTERVELKHDTQGTVTVDTQARTIVLANTDGDRLVAQYQVPVGTVTEIRIFASAATVFLKDGSTQDLELTGKNLPSWKQTGWKIVPEDGLAGFPIALNELTGVRALFDPDDRMVHNKPHGYKIKPTMQAELFDPNPAAHGPGVLIDHITFIAKPGVTTAQVEALAATAGATVVSVPTLSRWYRLKLPVTMDLERALLYFPVLPEADIVLPAVNYGLDSLPDEGSQPSLDMVGVPVAWDLAQASNAGHFVGSHRVRVAVAEGAIDVRHPDLRRNIGIHQGELPLGLFDTSGDGVVGPEEIEAHDCDPPGLPGLPGFPDFPSGDGVISIRDMECDSDIAPPDWNGMDVNGEVRIDAQDIANDDQCEVDFMGRPACWKDGRDDDQNGFTDDTVGWNFGKALDDPTRNDPSLPAFPPGTIHPIGWHATFVAGVIGAEGNNGRDLAGMSWRVSIVPLATSSNVDVGFTPHEALVEALKYSEIPDNRIDIFNMSIGHTLERKDPERGCGNTAPGQHVTSDIPDDRFAFGVIKYNAAFSQLFGEAGHTLYVMAAGNSSHDLTSESIYRVPFKPMRNTGAVSDRLLTIGAALTPATMATFSNYGDGVTVFAPGGPRRVLIPSQFTCKEHPSVPSDIECVAGCAFEGSHTVCEIAEAGTSGASPTVAGAGGLLAAVDSAFGYNGEALRAAILGASVPVPFVDCGGVQIANARLLQVDLLIEP